MLLKIISFSRKASSYFIGLSFLAIILSVFQPMDPQVDRMFQIGGGIGIVAFFAIGYGLLTLELKLKQQVKKVDISNWRLVGTGPVDGAWRGQFLRCPLCHDFVEKAGSNECSCGNIVMEGDSLRVTVVKSSEQEVEQYDRQK